MKSIRVSLRPTFWKGKAHNVKPYAGLKSKFLCTSGLWWWHGASLTGHLSWCWVVTSRCGEGNTQWTNKSSVYNQPSTRLQILEENQCQKPWHLSRARGLLLSLMLFKYQPMPTVFRSHLGKSSHSFQCKQCPCLVPRGSQAISTVWSGTARNQKRADMLMSRCCLSTSNSQQGSRESW